ncbi:MAG: RHS repeat-associated core domain-containing protein, partial [Clostridia bacterium]|nr:RHS repeat-associated core domain-containing protein [Clostridia bacterium]
GDHIIDYSYDDRGRKSERILWADGQYDVSTTTYTYDVLSRLTAVSNSSMPTATQNTIYTYDQNGRLLTETTGGLVTSYEYNNAGLVTVKSSVLPGMNSEDPYVIPAHYEYDYNTNGNQRGKHIPRDRHYISYTYDGAGRLVLEAHGGLGIDHQTSYVYDASGNRTREIYVANPTEQYGTLAINTTDYVYDANNRLISLSSGGVTNTYTYDNNGNMLADGSKTFTYNVLNQLVSFTNGPVTANYGYLPNGLRSYKSVTDGTNSTYNSFVWDGDKLAYEYTATNANTPQMYVGTVYNYGHGLVSHSDNLNGNYILYATDGHGDVTKLLDATNPNFYDPVDENEFDAFGNGGANEYSRMGYTGEYHDAETGFIYLRARYYSPAIGRFINEDPIRDGLNWYVYCNNNPVNFVDPTGLDAIVITSTDSVDVLGVSFGHTSVIAQDENGDWYYYYWGNKNAFVEPVPAEVMESLVNEGSLDSFNTWLNDDANKDKFENSTKSYEKSTYIEGDFSESVKYFESLIHGDSGDSGDNKSVIITRKVPTTSILGHTPDRVAGPYNKDYKPFSNNCVTTSIDGLEKGILPNGKRFHSPKTFIPNTYAYILEFECDY